MKNEFNQEVTHSICALIVTYQPDLNRLNELLTALVAQVAQIVIVDNHSSNVSADELQNLYPEAAIPKAFQDVVRRTRSRAAECTNQYMSSETSVQQSHNLKGEGYIHLIRLPENKGLAAAQNIGIQWAQEHRFEYVLYLDQDSRIHHTMVNSLFNSYQTLESQGKKVAAVGPRCVDEYTQKTFPFLQIHRWHIEKKNVQPSSGIIATDFLIASGSLIAVKNFQVIGLFSEKLFINNIDLDWCLRAKSLGYQCFGVSDAVLYQRLGDRAVKRFGMTFYDHAPQRQYYNFRNRIWLYKKSYFPAILFWYDLPRLIAKFFCYLLLMPKRFAHLRYMMQGIKDGILQKM